MINGLQTSEGSGGMVTPPGSSVRTDQVHQQPHIIEAMTAEISEATKDNIEGELLCLEAIYPQSVGESANILMEDDPKVRKFNKDIK